MANVDQTSEKVRARKGEDVQRWYFDAEGNRTPRVQLTSVGGGLHFVEAKRDLEWNLSDFDDGVRNAAALFGLMTSITNAFGGKETVEMLGAAEARLERFQMGVWASERGESGPRIGILLEALMRLRAEKGASTDAEARARWKDKLIAGGSDYIKGLREDPTVAAHYHAILREREDAAAKEAAEKARAAPPRADLLD